MTRHSTIYGLINLRYNLTRSMLFHSHDSNSQSLTTSQTFISAAGDFELGFFSPGKAAKYFVEIWYKKILERTIVWVANRDYWIHRSVRGSYDILWESFNYGRTPAGMKLGYDKRAGKTWSLVSWRSTEDPGLGDFSLEHDPDESSQIFNLQGPNRFWNSGMWDGQIFSQVLSPASLKSGNCKTDLEGV
ncbi:S-locus-specific glycoprotein S6-like [Vitis vinifera]|uniref:S-locus-specific glycoprotein S6-like n=1 Tax=Vitis vinifera TaxID=29760 RepID=UPI0028834D23|nr:S-locus-specific glycoprotein S6-like [Vitis vinifera]